MSSENITVSFETMCFYRRVVYTALQPFMERDELLAAMWEWEDNHASIDGQTLNIFIEDLCQGALGSKYNSILFNLKCHASDKSVVLDEDPYRLMVAYRSGRLKKAPQHISKTPLQTENMKLLYRQLNNMNAMLESENRYYTYLVRVYVDEALGEYQAGLSVEQVDELRQWMKNKEKHLEYDYGAKQISAVMNLFYIGVCEYFGTGTANKYSALSLMALK